MANILGRYGHGRELAHFKVEQEADIQELRKKLIKEGKLNAQALPGPKPAAAAVYDADGDEVSPVLMEVLQASARLNDPTASRRRIWELRRKAGLPPLSERELDKAVQQLRGGMPLAMIVPSSLSLSRSNSLREINAVARAARRAELRMPTHASPEQEMIARRTLMLGLRMAAYGTMASFVGVGVIGTATCHYYGITCLADLKQGLRTWAQSFREPLREYVAPVKLMLSGWAGRRDSEANSPSNAERLEPSDFNERMRRRFQGR